MRRKRIGFLPFVVFFSLLGCKLNTDLNPSQKEVQPSIEYGLFEESKELSNSKLTDVGLLVAKDLDQDGREDLLVSNNTDGFLILWNDGSANPDLEFLSFSHSTSIPKTIGANGAYVIGVDSLTSTLYLRHYLGNRQFGAQQTISYSGCTYPQQIDFNGDDYIDIVTFCSGSSDLRIYLGASDGTFSAPVSLPSVDGDYTSLSVLDIDDDGDKDVMLSVAGAIGTMVLNGTSLVQYSRLTLSGSGTVIYGNFHGDVKKEIVFKDTSAASVLVYALSGNAYSSTPIQTIPLNSSSDKLSFANFKSIDFNSDGYADLGILYPFLQETKVFFGGVSGLSEQQTINLPGAIAGGDALTAADIEGDGDIDLVTNSNYKGVYINDGSGVFTGYFSSSVVGPTGGSGLSLMSSTGSLMFNGYKAHVDSYWQLGGAIYDPAISTIREFGIDTQLDNCELFFRGGKYLQGNSVFFGCMQDDDQTFATITLNASNSFDYVTSNIGEVETFDTLNVEDSSTTFMALIPASKDKIFLVEPSDHSLVVEISGLTEVKRLGVLVDMNGDGKKDYVVVDHGSQKLITFYHN